MSRPAERLRAAPGSVTGHVTFFEGTSVLGTAAVDAAGEARLSTASLATGEHLLRADFGGPGHLTNCSAEAHHQVDKAATTAVITAFVPTQEQ